LTIKQFWFEKKMTQSKVFRRQTLATGRSVHFSSTLFTKDAASDVRCFPIAAERRCKKERVTARN
jgi:hypothetical protein